MWLLTGSTVPQEAKLFIDYTEHLFYGIKIPFSVVVNDLADFWSIMWDRRGWPNKVYADDGTNISSRAGQYIINNSIGYYERTAGMVYVILNCTMGYKVLSHST